MRLMFLKYRPVRGSDLHECLACVRDGFAYDATGRRDLLAFWREGLTSGVLDMLLMEDLDAPAGDRLLYFVCKTSMTREAAAQIKAGTPSTLGEYVLALWRREYTPLLPLSEVAATNSGRGEHGLHMATLHNGTPALFGRGDLAFVMKKMVEFAPFSTSGYRIEEYLIEGYGATEWAWLDGAGLRLRREGAPAGFPPDKSPRLYGVTEPEARESVGTMSSLMFQWQSPCFGFSRPEQELLLHALAGDTDEELAAALHIALITVRKRWGSIYGHVDAVEPELLGGAGAAVPDQRRRGEKKRRLLAYLRHHMEELRPHSLMTPPSQGRR